MLRRILIIGGACLGIGLMVSPALGVRSIPKKANKYQATIIQGVEACTTANAFAQGALSTPGCNPVVPSDPACVFLNGEGGGKALAKAKDDISIKVKLKKIDPGCEGQTLCAIATVRTATENCDDTDGAGGTIVGDCTTETQTDLPLGLACAAVLDGKLQIKTTVNQSLAGALVTGNSTEFTLGEVGLLRSGAAGAAFRAGLLLP